MKKGLQPRLGAWSLLSPGGVDMNFQKLKAETDSCKLI